MTTHNSLNWLRIFTDYLFLNTKDFKLYVSDSGSMDKTCEYLKKLKEKYPDIVTYRHTADNSGEAKGINWGASLGTSPYILWCSPDIILPDKWSEKMIAHFRKEIGTGEIVAVGPVSDMVSGRQQLSYSYGQYEDEVDLLIGFCMLVKRKAWQKVKGLDESFFYSHGDNDFSIKLAKCGYRMVIARDVFVKHINYQSASQIAVTDRKIFDKGKDLLLKKHGQELCDKASSIRPTVVIAIPFYGDCDNEFVSSLLSMRQPGGNGAVVFAKTDRTLIAPARNLLAKAALKYNSQFLLFLDSDMVFGKESLMRLLLRACDKNISIIGGLCYKRRSPFEPCIMRRVSEKDGDKWKYCQVTDPPGLYEVDGIGTAFMLIRTSVFKDLQEPYFYPDKEGLREDLNFCLDAKSKGHRIFVDTNVQIGHLGERLLIDHYFKNTQIELDKKEERKEEG